MIDRRLLQLVEEQVRLHDNLDWFIRKGNSWARFIRHDTVDGDLAYSIRIQVMEDTHPNYTEVRCCDPDTNPEHETIAGVALTDKMLAQTELPELRTIISGMASKVLR